MPLTLITGPANAAKAGAVLERLRAALSRDPVLVVPTSADAAHYARELAGAGLVFGADVTTFPRLMRDIARSRRRARASAGPAGPRPGRPRGDPRRRAARARRLGREPGLRRRARRPVRRAAALARLAGALRRGRAGVAGGRHRAAARRRAGRAVLRLPPAPGGARGARRRRPGARRAGPAARGVGRGGRCCSTASTTSRPPSSTSSRRSSATPTPRSRVALSYEPGRAALAGSAATVELLKPLAREHVMLDARSEHYAPSARGALHHLERSLFEPEPGRVPPNGAVRLLEAGGERAEAELVGASVLELLRDGMAPEDIAVLVRVAAPDLFAQVLEAYGIPVARDRRTPFAHTRLGTGVLAFARAALGGTANDVVTWLRTPGKLAATPTWPTGSRSRSAAHEARTAPRRAARHGTEARRRGPTELDALAAAGRGGRRAVPGRAAGRGRGDLDRAARPPRRRARPRRGGRRAGRPRAAGGGQGADPARRAGPRARRGRRRSCSTRSAATEVRETRAGRGRHARRAARRPAGDPRAALPGDPAVRAAGGRAAAAPAARAVPRRRRARRRSAIASGLVLPRHEATLPRERSLFYACVSRPEEALFLSFRSTTRRAGRSSRRRSWTTSARCSPTSCGRAAGAGCWPRSRGRRPRRRRRTSCAARRPPTATRPDPAPLRRARPTRGAARCSPPATASPPAGWRRSPTCPVQVADRARPQARARSTRTRCRCGAARSPTRCSSGRCAA